MSNEQQITEKKVNSKLLLTIGVILSLLFSIAALTMSIIALNGGGIAISGEAGHKKVVISKQFDKGQSYDKAVAKNKPMVVFFYTDWCGYCQRFAPTFHKITKDKRFKKNFAVAYVNCENDENHDLIREFNIQGFPTVFVVDNEGKKTQLENRIFFDENAKELVMQDILEKIQK